MYLIIYIGVCIISSSIYNITDHWTPVLCVLSIANYFELYSVLSCLDLLCDIGTTTLSSFLSITSTHSITKRNLNVFLYKPNTTMEFFPSTIMSHFQVFGSFDTHTCIYIYYMYTNKEKNFLRMDGEMILF